MQRKSASQASHHLKKHAWQTDAIFCSFLCCRKSPTFVVCTSDNILLPEAEPRRSSFSIYLSHRRAFAIDLLVLAANSECRVRWTIRTPVPLAVFHCPSTALLQDIGWKPFVESWAATREDANERQVLPTLFEKYVEVTRTVVRKGFKEVTPLRVLNKVQWEGRNRLRV